MIKFLCLFDNRWPIRLTSTLGPWAIFFANADTLLTCMSRFPRKNIVTFALTNICVEEIAPGFQKKEIAWFCSQCGRSNDQQIVTKTAWEISRAKDIFSKVPTPLIRLQVHPDLLTPINQKLFSFADIGNYFCFLSDQSVEFAQSTA